MGIYILRRLLISIPTLIGISMVLYLILAMAPGDPLSQFAADPSVPPEVRENIRRQLGLNDPVYIQYFKWLRSMVTGDWGFSFATRAPVSMLIQQRLPQTLLVVGLAYILSVLLAIPIGVLSSIKPYSWFDNIATTFAFIGFSVPTFFTGLLLILIFSVNLRWLPFIYDSTLRVDNWDALIKQIRQMIMPVTVLTLFQTGTMTRYVRASMLDNLPQDYTRTARSKGLAKQTVIIRHVLRNSLIPVVTLVALGVPTIFSGAIVTEQIFRINGIGELLIKSIQNSDTPVVMAITFIFASLVVIFNLVADVLYGILDPRIRYH
ncbi:MAG: ABC transporter permease [Caldilineaceae bacterium]|nr:ABC transporter permease [Caldilineaceae bacterium]